MDSTTGRRRSGGRRARHVLRSAPPAISPAPPGQTGGMYRPLTEAQIDAIYRTALDLLADPGMGEVPPDLLEAATARGAYLTPLGRLAFPPALVEEVIAATPGTFLWPGRDPAHDIEVGGERVHFGTGGAAVQTLDPETGLYRASTLADLHAFARLAEALPNLSWFTRCCIATDVEDPFALDASTAWALVANTTKPVGTAFTLAEHVDPIVDMFDRLLGGEGRFRARPFCKAHISPVISPLRYGADAVAVIRACTARGVPINCIIAAQAGATAPAVPAAFLAQSLAETLAGLMAVQVFAPGHPTIFSNWPFVIDLRTGAFSGGGAESALLNAAAAQLSNRLGLPSGVACAMSDAKGVDAQMGGEKALSALAAGLAGANMVYESAAMTASLLGASFEAMVLDDELLGQVHRVLRGIEVDEERLGAAAIREAVLGEGHFLGHPQTMAAMERDHLYPALADRDTPAGWTARGAPDVREAARAKVRNILARPAPDLIGPGAERIRGRLPVRIP